MEEIVEAGISCKLSGYGFKPKMFIYYGTNLGSEDHWLGNYYCEPIFSASIEKRPSNDEEFLLALKKTIDQYLKNLKKKNFQM